AASHSISAPRQPISAPPTPPTTPTVRSDHPPPVCVAAPSKRVLWTSLRFRRKTLPLPGSWTFTTSLLGRELAPLALNGIVNARQSEVPVSFASGPAKPSVREKYAAVSPKWLHISRKPSRSTLSYRTSPVTA